MEQERLKEEFLKRKKELEKALIEVFGEEGYRLLVELYESGALRHLFWLRGICWRKNFL